MEPAVLISIGVVALIVLPFILAVLVARPLVNSIADRISGQKNSAKEMKDLKKQVSLLHEEIGYLRGKVMLLEEEHTFAQKMLEDIEKRTLE